MRVTVRVVGLLITGGAALWFASGCNEASEPTDPAAWEDVLRRWLTTPELREAWRRAAQVRRGQLRTWADTAADLRRGLFG